MSGSSRPELEHLLSKLVQFREGAIGLDELQTILWGTAEALTSREDRRLRELLQAAEGRVELIRFTVAESRAIDEIRCVVDVIDAAVKDVRSA